jgi:hypothetical protein
MFYFIENQNLNQQRDEEEEEEKIWLRIKVFFSFINLSVCFLSLPFNWVFVCLLGLLRKI